MTDTSPSLTIEAPPIPLRTYFLFFGQAINLIAAVLSVTVAASVGSKLAPDPLFATIPYGLQFAAVMIFTYPASVFMKHFGRRRGFLLGTLPLIASGSIGYLAVVFSNFAALSASHFLLGVFVAFANFYRFAAVDDLPNQLRSKAISLVVSGGVVAAVVGPILAISLREVAGFPEYSLCYAGFSALGLLSFVLLFFWSGPKHSKHARVETQGKGSTKDITFPIFLSILSSASGYLIMNLLMIQSALVMDDMNVHFTSISHAIQLHVLAMFAPSFITGQLISRFGVKKVLVSGFVLLCASAASGTVSQGYNALVLSLVLLGAGWNFTYVGGAALLTQHLDDSSAYRWQGINDLAIAVSATIGALSPSLLIATVGWQTSNLACLALAATGATLCLRLSCRKQGVSGNE